MIVDPLFDLVIAFRNRYPAAIPRLLCFLALLACPCGPGCTHESRDDDAHLEHVIPPHKPATYADTVEQLDVRWDRLLGSVDSPGTQWVTELGDIVRWLPELAADSDLNRRQWEQVQSLSQELAMLHGRLASSTVADEDRARWRQIMASLQELVPASDEHAPRTTSAKPRDVEDASHEPTAAISSGSDSSALREEVSR